MAFVIKCGNREQAEQVWRDLAQVILKSRFTLSRPNMGRRQRDSVEIVRRRGGKYDVEIRGVRLQEAKDYCGNHAGPCRVFPGFHRRHRKGTWLEGLDWVSWNDLLNDYLDSIGHAGDAGSSFVNIRKAGLRRTHYDQANEHGEWEKEGGSGEYADYRGKAAPRSTYPAGTPGLLGV